ncbi:hypothetical protein [Paracoccus pacificus]|uniref:Uncharacterized protein n=1 Tax=Paracoccus pacificus TaxID=1463598 RepID=A0ABW4R9K3_9RHOB
MRLGGALAGVAAVVGVAAAASAEDLTQPWQAALGAASQRLSLYSVTRAAPPGSEEYIAGRAHLMGVDHKAGIEFLGKDWFARPILTYESNFNDKIPGRTIKLGGLTFVVAPEDRAKGGGVVGLRAGGAAVWSYAQGSTITAATEVGLRYLPAHDLTRVNADLSVCATNWLGGWTWADACAAYFHINRNDGEEVDERQFSLGLTNDFSAAGADHEISGGLRLTERPAYSKTSVDLSWEGALPQIGALRMGAMWGEEIPGQNTSVRGVNLRLARPIRDQPTVIGIDVQWTKGAQIFGFDRTDRIVGVSVQRQVWRDVTATLQLRQTDSSVDVFDETTASLDFSFANWRF